MRFGCGYEVPSFGVWISGSKFWGLRLQVLCVTHGRPYVAGLHQKVFKVCRLLVLLSTYFRFMELAGTGSSQANLTAEPAEAVNYVVNCCSRQSRAIRTRLISTYFRVMELAGTGSSQANLTAEPAEAADWCSRQSRAMGQA